MWRSQIAGAFAGVAAAHVMFELPLFSASRHARQGQAQMFSEFVATFGLLAVIGAARACARPRCRSPCRLHHGGLLVHRVHVVRQPGGDARAGRVGHVRWRPAGRRARLHRGAAAWAPPPRPVSSDGWSRPCPGPRPTSWCRCDERARARQVRWLLAICGSRVGAYMGGSAEHEGAGAGCQFPGALLCPPCDSWCWRSQRTSPGKCA